jgi:hypothetical protein
LLMKVWTVWRYTSGLYPCLAEICIGQEALDKVVEEQVAWIRDYHGQSFPVHLDEKLDINTIRTQYGDRIAWEEREVKE